MSGPEGDELARQRIEDYANRLRPPGFLVRILLFSFNQLMFEICAGLYSDTFRRPWCFSAATV